MAISTAINLTDGMSRAFQSITNAMNTMLLSWQAIDSEMSGGLDFEAAEKISSDLAAANSELDQMADGQKKYNNKVLEGQDAVDGLVGKIGGLVAAIGFAKVASEAIEFASDLAEVQNVVDVSFGDNSVAVDEWAKTTLNAFGLNELSAKQFAGTMGAMLKSSGLAGDEVAEMSMRITELAGDMASFYNLEGEEAFAKIRSGISGETEPLKQLGINMSVANLEAYALAQGITTAYSEMSQAEQVALRYEYLLQATADAQGDFARTQSSYANQTKLMHENWTAFTGALAANAIPTLTLVFNILNNGLAFAVNHIEVIGPLLTGLLTLFGAYVTALAVYNGVKMVSAAVETVHAAQMAFSTGATFAEVAATTTATGAQIGFNAALLACPLTWIVVAIVAVIAAIVAVCNWIAKTTDVADSAFGVITGALTTVLAFVWNEVIGTLNAIIQWVWSMFVEPIISIVEWVLNVFNGGFDSFGGAVMNLLGNLISGFLSFGKVATKIIDAIFGTDWTSGLEDLQDKVLAWGKSDDAITLSREAPEVLSRMEYGKAFENGAKWGDSVSNKVGEFLSPEVELPVTPEMENIEGYTSDIDGSADNIAGSLDIANEDIKYLRDIAERDTINRFTTAEVRVELGGVNNTVNNNTDLDGMIDYLTDEVRTALEIVREGVELA